MSDRNQPVRPRAPVALLGVPRELSSQRLLAPASTGEPEYGGHGVLAFATDAAATARYAYLVNWDENSFSSLKRNARSLDHLIVEWLHVVGPGGVLLRDAPIQEALVNGWLQANAPQLKVLPSVNNYDEVHSRWDPAAAEAVLQSAPARGQFASDIDRFVTDGHYAGVVLDLEQIPIDAQSDYVKLVHELAEIFRDRGLQLLVALAPNSTAYDYAGLAAAADGLIVMSYDEHTEKGVQGPLASQGWFETVLARHLKSIPADKLIVSIGSYGYDWENGQAAQEISVQEAWELLEESRARLSFDKNLVEPNLQLLRCQQPSTAPGLVSGCGDRLRSNRRGIACAAQGLGIVAAREPRIPAFGRCLAAAGRRSGCARRHQDPACRL